MIDNSMIDNSVDYVEHFYLKCDCGHPVEHLIVFSNYGDDEDFIVHTTMNHFLPWYKRIPRAIKYVMSVQNITHVESVVSQENIDSLVTWLNKR